MARDLSSRTSIVLLTILIVCVIYLIVAFHWKKDCQSCAKSTAKEKHIECTAGKDATHIKMHWSTSEATLVYDSSAFVNTTCCYHEILRTGSGQDADTKFKLTPCTQFNKTTILPPTIEYIYVKCESNKQTVYVNTHAIMRDRPEIRKRLNKLKEKSKDHRPLSVLMLSIDSVSRLNFIRSMPQTYKSLHDREWFELQGYNKMDDNTYPNLMAILTGYNLTLALEKCEPETIGKLDTCPFIWNDFRDTGYATVYAEDEPSFSTFNSHSKRGFLRPPTDYYLRPYMMAAEALLPIEKKKRLNFCLGSRESGVHVYDYAMDYATHFKKDPSYGLFWLNSFSHDDMNDPSAMDDKVSEYIQIMEDRGILSESMVVMFSDHGMRYGEVRHLVTGWLEERTPFIFIWLPPWFRNEHPEFVEALKINRNRLTNPYDMHMTLKHILQLADPSREYKPAPNCEKCQSLFHEVPWNRTCEEISIDSHWCTCPTYRDQDVDDRLVQGAVKYALDDINQLLEKYDGEHLCARLKLKRISHARKAEHHKPNDSFVDYLVTFLVSPSDAWFESTVRYRENSGFEMTALTSRLNQYGNQSDCSDAYHLRKFCYCKNFMG